MSRTAPPLVSVVVPSYNHAAWIEESLRSVAAQTHGPIELVVVDDASRDGTADVVQRVFDDPAFAARFGDRLVLARLATNGGAHAALNHGLALARGEWLTVLNSDDRYHPDRLSILLSALDARGRALAFSEVRFVDPAGRDVTGGDPFAAELAATQRRIQRSPSVGFALLRENVAITTGNLLFSRELLARAGGFRGLRYCHDWDFVLRCLLFTEPLYVGAPLYDYRLHATNSFRSLGPIADAETQECLRAYFSAIRQSAFTNPLAPGPATWPRVFDRFVAGTGLEYAWLRSSGATNARAAARSPHSAA